MVVLLGPAGPQCAATIRQDASQKRVRHGSQKGDKATERARPSAPPATQQRELAPTPTSTPYMFSDCLFYARQPIERKSLVLTATTAHTGTSYLTALLETADGIEAVHEDDPSLVSFPAVMRHGRAATLAFRTGVKIPPIYRRLASPGPPAFADVSHLFLKSWADAGLHCLARDQRVSVSIVALRRYLPDLVRSLMTDVVWAAPSLNGFCGSEYTVHHTNVAALPPLKAYEEEDVVDLVIGHILDIEVQLAALRAVYGRGFATDGGEDVEDQTPYASDGFSTRRFSPDAFDAYRASIVAVAAATDAAVHGAADDTDGASNEGSGPRGRRQAEKLALSGRGLPSAIALMRSLAPPPPSLVSRPRFIDARLEAIAAPHGARDLLGGRLRLGVQDKPLASRMGSGPVNARVSWKAPALQRIPDSFFLARAQRMMEAYAAAGVILPPMPQMDKLVPCDSLPLGVRPQESYVMRASEPPPLCSMPYIPMDAEQLQAALDAYPDHPVVTDETVAALMQGRLIGAATQTNGTLLGRLGLPAIPLNYRVADIQASAYRTVCPV